MSVQELLDLFGRYASSQQQRLAQLTLFDDGSGHIGDDYEEITFVFTTVDMLVEYLNNQVGTS